MIIGVLNNKKYLSCIWELAVGANVPLEPAVDNNAT
jgi:hypothetical protein